MSTEQLSRRLALEATLVFSKQTATSGVWLDEDCQQLLRSAGVPLPEQATPTDGPLAMALVQAHAVAEDGHAWLSPACAGQLQALQVATTVAVVRDMRDGAAILASGEAPAAPHGYVAADVQRVLLPHAVLQVQAEGLVILELQSGVSAADLQAAVSPTLKISSTVAQLQVAPKVAPPDDG